MIPRRLLAVTADRRRRARASSRSTRPAPTSSVSHEYPTAKRTIREVKTYSSGFPALLSAPSGNRVWGGATSGMRAEVHSKNEDVFFPGGLILVLALIGLAGSRGGSPMTLDDCASGSDSGS